MVQATLTEGAIGYRKFAVISGQKAMAVLRLQDGSHPPFGAEVKNDNEQTVGLVDDDGSVYLAGVKPGEHMSVFWSGVAHCDINLPDPLLPICLTACYCHASIKATSRRLFLMT
ncbi:outer membrane export usher protein [Escherichia coli]|nr:outer membrane export usher protein [Escherichia coli]